MRFRLIEGYQQYAGEAVFDVRSAFLGDCFCEKGPFFIGGGPELEARGAGDIGGAARPVCGDDAGGSPGGARSGPALFDDGDAPARFAEFSRRQETHDAATDDNDVAHELPFYVVNRLDVLPMGLYHGGSAFPQAGESHISRQKNDGPGEPSFWVI